MKLLCYGDSNTYGFDARGPLGSRYDEDTRWCDRLAALTGWQVDNAGQNGRCIPHHPAELALCLDLFRARDPEAALILLGTNDVLLHGRSADEVARRMEGLLGLLRQQFPLLPLILLTPPPLALPEPELNRQIPAIAGAYGRLASRLGVRCLDSLPWDLELAADGLHLSRLGHRQLAQALARALPALLKKA